MTASPAVRELSPSEIREQELWVAWRERADASARTALFFLHAEWSRMLASSLLSLYPHPPAEWHDYVQLASIGLLKAIDRFDPAIQPRFRTYAELFVKGDVMKGLSCFRRDSRAGTNAARLQASMAVDDGELYGLEEIVDVAVGLAFGHFLELGITDPGDQASNPLHIYEEERQFGALLGYVGLLPPREQQLVVAHYFQHLPFSEIAGLLGVSRPRVTQLHRQALARMRKWYEGEAEAGAGQI